MINNYELIIGILALISVLLTTFMIFLSCYLKPLRKHPGGLVTIKYISVLFYNLHFSLLPSMHTQIRSSLCPSFSAIFIFFYFLIWNYTTCLSIEVFIKVKKITNTSYSRRRKIYHSVSLITSGLLTTVIGIFESFGETSYNSCFVKKRSLGHYFELVPIGLNFPLIIVFSVLSIKNTSKAFEPLMVGLTVSSLLLAVTLMVSNLFTFFDMFGVVNEVEMNVGAAIAACSGIVVSGSRMLSKSLYVKMKRTWRRSLRKYQMDEFCRESHDESSEVNYYKSNIWNLSMFFDNLTKKTVAEILITLYMRFKNEKNKIFDKKFVISYNKAKYELLCISMPHIKNRKFHLVYKDEIIIIEYYPRTFERIRKTIGIFNEILHNSLINSDNFLSIKIEDTNKGGHSGSFFFKTSDGLLILKTIKRSERKSFLNKMLRSYTEHIANKSSKIVRILGVFKVLPSDLDFIIMENIVPDQLAMCLYDIKGYLSDNRVGTNDIKKDNEFIQEFAPIDKSLKTEVIRTLREDLSFLRGQGVMDYSVLIADLKVDFIVHSRYAVRDSPRPLLIAVIDFFQEFNLRKTAEYRIKKLFTRQAISCVNPSEYYIRILNFLVKYL